MKPRHSFNSMMVALVVTIVAIVFFIACSQSQPPAPSAPAVASQSPTTEKVFIVFEGPWAFAPDPKDPGSVVAIAPKTKGHRDLFVKASHHTVLAAGVYNLSLPAHSGPAAATADPSIAKSDVDPQNLQHALDSKSVRYVIHLPKPEEYRVAARSKSRVGKTYPPDASTEKDYASSVSFRYNVATLEGFSLAGTVDDGTFTPLPLQVETPVIRFVIRPAQEDDPADKCDTHSRQAFHDLTALLGLTLYVDFPDNSADCHAKDPQNSRPVKAAANTRWERLVARLTANLADVDDASVPGSVNGAFFAGWSSAVGSGQSLAGYRLAAMYFFSMPKVDCNGPPLILNPTTTPNP